MIPSNYPTPGPTASVPGGGGSKSIVIGADKRCWDDERETIKRFSVTTIKTKIEEYKAGKYTEKYIRTYLDFVHLEGLVDNLTYLSYKEFLDPTKG